MISQSYYWSFVYSALASLKMGLSESASVSRSIWNGRVTDPKTRKGRSPVPVIRQVAERLEMHRLRSGIHKPDQSS